MLRSKCSDGKKIEEEGIVRTTYTHFTPILAATAVPRSLLRLLPSPHNGQIFGSFQTTTAGCEKTDIIWAVFQQCFYSNDFCVVSVVFQQSQSFFLTGCKKMVGIWPFYSINHLANHSITPWLMAYEVPPFDERQNPNIIQNHIGVSTCFAKDLCKKEVPSWDTCFCELAQIGPFVYDFWSFL